MALVYYSLDKNVGRSFKVFSWDILPYAKLRRPASYRHIMRDLAEQGYISYETSQSPVRRSRVELFVRRDGVESETVAAERPREK